MNPYKAVDKDLPDIQAGRIKDIVKGNLHWKVTTDEGETYRLPLSLCGDLLPRPCDYLTRQRGRFSWLPRHDFESMYKSTGGGKKDD